MERFKEWHKENGLDKQGSVRTLGSILKDPTTPIYIIEWANTKPNLRQKMKDYVNYQRKSHKQIKHKK